MLEHPQVLARQMVVETHHPKAGATRALGCPVKFSDTPARIRRPAPLFGQHTREVLTEAGFNEAEISALLETSAAVQGQPS
jgi:crotonobetainyl-CoA:carnitine CoA-transferase CaiB-like acyl-CoA transferase